MLASGDGGGSTAGGFGVDIQKFQIGNRKIIVTYDFYENDLKLPENSPKIEFDFGGPNLSWVEKARMAISRIKNLHPSRFAQYEKFLNEITEPSIRHVNFETNTTFAKASDIGMASFAGNDQPIQLAVQAAPRGKRKYRYKIDSEFWADMDNNQRAMLITHEIIYHDVLNINPDDHTTSELVRQFNRALWSVEAKTWTLQNYIQEAISARLRYAADQLGNDIMIPYAESYETFMPLFWSETTLKSAYLTKFHGLRASGMTYTEEAASEKILTQEVSEVLSNTKYKAFIHYNTIPVYDESGKVRNFSLYSDDRSAQEELNKILPAGVELIVSERQVKGIHLKVWDFVPGKKMILDFRSFSGTGITVETTSGSIDYNSKITFQDATGSKDCTVYEINYETSRVNCLKQTESEYYGIR